MTWFKVDDSFYDHPKVYDAPDCAVALWTRAGCWSARNLTDGYVPSSMLARLCGDPHVAARELVKRGLWIRTKGGYRYHDWTAYQPSKEEVEELRAARAEAGRKGGVASGKARSKPRSKTEASASPIVEPPTRPDPTPKRGRGRSVTHCPSADAPPHAPNGAAALTTHAYTDDGTGVCHTCRLPAGNRHHLRLVDGGAA